MLFIFFFKSCVDFMPRFWFHVNQINVFHCVSADDDSADDDFEVDPDADYKGEELRNNIQDLFAPGKLTKSNLRELLESFSFPSEVGNELAARSAPAPSSVAKASLTSLMEHTHCSVFIPLEILLRRLAMKHHWTDAEFQGVVDLVSSLQFKSEDIGLDLKRRVGNTNMLFRICFVSFSYFFRILEYVFCIFFSL
jgi:hypothetical protein